MQESLEKISSIFVKGEGLQASVKQEKQRVYVQYSTQHTYAKFNNERLKCGNEITNL